MAWAGACATAFGTYPLPSRPAAAAALPGARDGGWLPPVAPLLRVHSLDIGDGEGGGGRLGSMLGLEPPTLLGCGVDGDMPSQSAPVCGRQASGSTLQPPSLGGLNVYTAASKPGKVGGGPAHGAIGGVEKRARASAPTTGGSHAPELTCCVPGTALLTPPPPVLVQLRCQSHGESVEFCMLLLTGLPADWEPPRGPFTITHIKRRGAVSARSGGGGGAPVGSGPFSGPPGGTVVGARVVHASSRRMAQLLSMAQLELAAVAAPLKRRDTAAAEAEAADDGGGGHRANSAGSNSLVLVPFLNRLKGTLRVVAVVSTGH